MRPRLDLTVRAGFVVRSLYRPSISSAPAAILLAETPRAAAIRLSYSQSVAVEPFAHAASSAATAHDPLELADEVAAAGAPLFPERMRRHLASFMDSSGEAMLHGNAIFPMASAQHARTSRSNDRLVRAFARSTTQRRKS
jgi:hypothetical protein